MRKATFSRKTTFLLCVAWLLTSLINCSPVKEIPPGNDRFGLCFISGPNHMADEARYRGALATGARWDRWPLYWHWVDEVGYADTHPDGETDYDTLVTQEIAHGLTPVVILMGTPARHARTDLQVGAANSSPQNSVPSKAKVLAAMANTPTLPPASLTEPIFADGTDIPGAGKTINPANAWAFFVFTTVERYRPLGKLARQQGWPPEAGIRYWEVWNEPDYASFWRGTVEEYYRLLEVAYKSIKAADPAGTVILGGLTFYDPQTWFPALLNLAEGQPNRTYFDVFSFHRYLSIYESERLIRQARATLDAHNLPDVPIWITESGLSVWDDYPATAYGIPANALQHGTMAEQAAYIIQNSALAFYHGVERYYHFMLHDDCGSPPGSAYGLRQNLSPHVCDPAEGKPRPAYAAYQLAAEQFRDLRPLWREKQDDQDQLAFYRPDDKSRLVVLWARQGLTVTTTLTATSNSAQLFWVEPTETPAGTTGLSRTLTLTPTNDLYTLTLLPATNQNGLQPNDPSYQIGGPPIIVVERDTQPPHSTQIQPLPPTSPTSFVLQWQGEDPGSGIAGYDVYAGEEDEPLQLWLDNTPQTEAKYTGQIGHTYSFAVRARDQAGNEEPQPAHPQVKTQIISGAVVSGVVLGPSGESVANAGVAIIGPNTEQRVVTNFDGLWLPMSLRPGNYAFRASAPGYGSWSTSRRINLTHFPVTITTTLAPPTNVIVNGDFEGNQVWKVWQSEGQVTLTSEAFDGQSAARLGDSPGGESTVCPDGQPGQLWTLSQQVSIPVDPAPVLSFLYKISTPEISSSNAWLEVLLVMDGQPYFLITPNELGPTSDWMLASRDVSTWQGQAVELQFKVQRCSDQPFSVNLDRISIGPGVAP